MSERTKSETRKKLALEMFLTGKYQQKEIAVMLGVSQQSIVRWAKVGKWDTLRANISTTKESILSSWYAQLAELKSKIEERKQGERIATSKESDTMIKIAAAIRKLETETGIAETVSVCTKLCEFVRAYDVEKAREISDHFNAYIESLLK
ncbi:MAG: DUF1804 family protein [Bacteroidales bacterium]|jgi:transposase|nr:DUF1804 family protein [Bacteroidales bacterium]